MNRNLACTVALLLASTLASSTDEPTKKPPKRADEPFRIFVEATARGEPSVVEEILEAREELEKRVRNNGNWFRSVDSREEAEIVIELQAYWVREERRTHDETYTSGTGRHTTQIDTIYEHHSLRAIATILGRPREMTGAQVKSGGGSAKGAVRDLGAQLERYCKENYWDLDERRGSR